MPGPEGFDYETRGGEVVITHHGRRATVLRAAAARFLADVEDGSSSADQESADKVRASIQAHERTAKQHPRNSGR